MFNDDDDYGIPTEDSSREKLNFPLTRMKSFDFGNCMFFTTSLNGEHWVEVWMCETMQMTPMIHIGTQHTNATIVEAFSLIITREQLREIMDYIRGE